MDAPPELMKLATAQSTKPRLLSVLNAKRTHSRVSTSRSLASDPALPSAKKGIWGKLILGRFNPRWKLEPPVNFGNKSQPVNSFCSRANFRREGASYSKLMRFPRGASCAQTAIRN